MRKRIAILAAITVFSFGTFVSIYGDPVAQEETESFSGTWYGSWYFDPIDYGSVFKISFFQELSYAIVHVPQVGLINQPLPVQFWENDLAIYAGTYTFHGTFNGESINGWIALGDSPVGTWAVYPDIEEPIEPGPAPGPFCSDLPALFVVGDSDYVTELLPFDPDYGQGYIDYPMNGETWEDQYRSYARRDLIQLIKYATAKVACKTSGWDYWDLAGLGLVDMSEVDGSIPGSSIGYPAHPPGTHENGNDMDLAYYQMNTPDNRARDIGYHYEQATEVYHLTSEPFCLDPFRTALLISYLADHPHLRVIGVDGQVGLVLEDALDILVDMGWIDSNHRESIPLAYEVEDQGYGWFRFHYHHLHVSMRQIYDLASIVDIKPDVLNRNNNGKYITAYLEMVEGVDLNDLDISSIMLIINKFTAIPVVLEKVSVTDYNKNGIPDLTLKFDRRLVNESIGTGTVEVALTGLIEGVYFEGVDTIYILK